LWVLMNATCIWLMNRWTSLRVLIGVERRQILEQPPVAAAIDRGAGPLRGEALVAGDRPGAHQ
jgi:hypothetical protein